MTLAPPRAHDAVDLVTAVNDVEVVRWLARVPHPYTLADASVFLEEVAPHELVFLARLREGGGLAGLVGIKPQGEGEGEGELGYWFASAHWGAGFATEAGRRLVDFAFADVGLARLTAVAAQDNPRSRHVLEKLGFVETGRSLRPVLFLGREAPHIEFTLHAPA